MTSTLFFPFEEDIPMRRTFTIAATLFALLLLSARPMGAAEPKGVRKTDPPGAPLELRLTSKRASYPLDLGGKTAEEFRKQLKDAEKSGKLPPPPAVKLVLDLRNTGDKDVQVQIGGDNSDLLLHLKGPGAVSVDAKRAFTLDFRAGRTVTLAPGKSATIEMDSLSYGFREQSRQSSRTGSSPATTRCPPATSSPSPRRLRGPRTPARASASSLSPAHRCRSRSRRSSCETPRQE
jgi:hypothetical protein